MKMCEQQSNLYYFRSIQRLKSIRTCTSIHSSSFPQSQSQSSGAVEYTDCISAEGLDSTPKECPWYDTKKSDGVASVALELWGITE